MVEIKAAVKIKPEEYFQYFEDLVFAPNAELVPKGTPWLRFYSNIYRRIETFMSNPMPIITVIIDDPP